MLLAGLVYGYVARHRTTTVISRGSAPTCFCCSAVVNVCFWSTDGWSPRDLWVCGYSTASYERSFSACYGYRFISGPVVVATAAVAAAGPSAVVTTGADASPAVSPAPASVASLALGSAIELVDIALSSVQHLISTHAMPASTPVASAAAVPPGTSRQWIYMCSCALRSHMIGLLVSVAYPRTGTAFD